MRSPLIQADMQRDSLIEYLRINKSIYPLVQGTTINILVAISDSGSITRPRRRRGKNVRDSDDDDYLRENIYEDVCKADQAPDHIRSLVRFDGRKLDANSLTQVTSFLLAHHQPSLLNVPAST
jgi:hypothetical protein